MTRAQLGDRVRVHYLGRLKRGSKCEDLRDRQLLEFTVGSEDVISGISRGVLGMAEGEKKRLTLQPQDAYGTVRRKLIKEIPRQKFPVDLVLFVGKRLISVGANSRRRRRVRIVGIKPDSVTVDGNHPLAGEVLDVELRLITLSASSPDIQGAR